jgi:hypothetical protein
MPRPSHPPRLDYSNLSRRRVQITKLLVMQLSPFSRHFIPLRSYPPQHLVLKHPQSMFLPWCQRPSFTPIQNHGQNYSLVFLIFTFIDSRQEGRGFWTEQWALPEFSLPLICSWIKFWFVTVVPKYLNCDIFSNDLLAIFMSRFLVTIRQMFTYTDFTICFI